MLRADRLVALRKDKGLKQKDLADAVGLERTTFVRYEGGGIQPPNDMVVKLADYFDVTTDYLLGKSDSPGLIIPEILERKYAAFDRCEFEDLTQDEVDTLANIAETLKKQRRLR
jgi:transcriptional regulator with XRE-family HTH domain